MSNKKSKKGRKGFNVQKQQTQEALGKSLGFVFYEAEINYILQVLETRPHREVNTLINNIVEQAKPQLQPKEVTPKKPKLVSKTSSQEEE